MRRQKKEEIVMPELQTDEQRLARAGGNLPLMPPTPSIDPSQVSINQQERADLFTRLGQVAEARLLANQQKINEATLAEGYNYAMGNLNVIINNQLKRQGFNVGAVSATADHEAMDDIITVYNRETRDLLERTDSHFTNDYQRQEFRKQIASAVLSGFNTVNRHYDSQIDSATRNSLNSQFSIKSNRFQDYVFDGNTAKARQEVLELRSMVFDSTQRLGGSTFDAQNAFDGIMNRALTGTIQQLMSSGRSMEAANVWRTFGATYTTGETRELLTHQIQGADRINQSYAIRDKILSEPGARNADGTINQQYYRKRAMEETANLTVTEVQRTSMGNVNAITDDHILQYITGNEGTPDGRTSIDGARGTVQIMPETFRQYAARAGLGDDAPMTEENMRIAAVAYFRKLLDDNDGDVEAATVGYFAGDQAGIDYHKAKLSGDQETLNVILARADGNGTTVEDYLNLSQARREAIFGGAAGAPQRPTYDIPVQAGTEDFDLSRTNQTMRDSIPYMGGIIQNDLATYGYDMSVVEVSSGWRSPANNAANNGEADSYHLSGDAIDIVLPESLTQEQAEKIRADIEATGLYEDVLFHNVGSGWHLHLEHINPNKFRQFTQGQGGAGYSVTSYNVTDPELASMVIQAGEIQARDEAQTRDQLIQSYGMSLIHQRYGGEQACISTIMNMDIPDPIVQGAQLAPEAKYRLAQWVWQNSDENRGRRDTARNRQEQAYQEAQAAKANRESFYSYLIANPNASLADMQANPYFQQLPADQKYSFISAAKKGEQSALSQVLSTGTSAAVNQVASAEGWTQQDYIKRQALEDYVHEQANEFYRQNNKLPTHADLYQFAIKGAQQERTRLEEGVLWNSKEPVSYSENSFIRQSVTFDENGNPTDTSEQRNRLEASGDYPFAYIYGGDR